MQSRSTMPPQPARRRASSLEDAVDLRRPRRVSPLCLVPLFATFGLLHTVAPAAASDPLETLFAEARREMVQTQIRSRGVTDPATLHAMEWVPRHLFVPEAFRDQAHSDRALTIGHEQNIFQPWLVAKMTELLDLGPGDRVLEIGTGSGYHTAVLSQIAHEVYSIEIKEDLSRRAATRLRELGIRNVELRVGDGYEGWPDAAPFDAIILTAAPPDIPQPLIDQLKIGGVLVAPVGTTIQELQVLTRTGPGPDGIEKEFKDPLMVPKMVGEGLERHR